MFLHQKPIPGYWYSNAEGVLLCVRALMYYKGVQSLVTLEDVSGVRQHVNPKAWAGMDLILHSPVEQGATA